MRFVNFESTGGAERESRKTHSNGIVPSRVDEDQDDERHLYPLQERELLSSSNGQCDDEENEEGDVADFENGHDDSSVVEELGDDVCIEGRDASGEDRLERVRFRRSK